MTAAAFNGAKLLLTHGDRLLTCLRDDRPDIPFPAHWDLPGGGREGQEAPVQCALRELDEEFGLHLSPQALTGRAFPSHSAPGLMSWLFAGQISAAQIAAIRFGNEGQGWCMMPVADYLTHPRAIPHFCRWITAMRQ
ncbi:MULTISPECIES: NUDIX hydrolase [Paracoccus]|uniref:NUDIX hydrolase n=1 Tax=Paracoccus TaxID=265 RepID=UPI000FDCA2FD|nr:MULTISPECIES: NUDIX hydrolase [Paracoccus]AZY92815.1 NUDIX domain-containing protein [Paracoccus sp. Arc7-R13]TNB88595.1 NUDIX domain-containing protein [Paracoccus marcusii]